MNGESVAIRRNNKIHAGKNSIGSGHRVARLKIELRDLWCEVEDGAQCAIAVSIGRAK